MREMTMNEICCVGGGTGLEFTSPITLSTMNNVANATTVGRVAGVSFAIGYAVGTWLNNKFDISTRIVDLLY